MKEYSTSSADKTETEKNETEKARAASQQDLNAHWRQQAQWLTFLVLAGYWLFLYTMTHLPVEEVPDLPTSDKLLHFLAYAGLSFWAGLRLWSLSRWNSADILRWMGVLAGFAAFDELTQPMVNRSAEWGDWAADLLGIVAGLGLVVLLRLSVAGFLNVQQARDSVRAFRE